jgi:hypothetical protein
MFARAQPGWGLNVTEWTQRFLLDYVADIFVVLAEPMFDTFKSREREGGLGKSTPSVANPD